MKFELKQQIAGTLDEVERAMMDQRYTPFLLAHHGVLLEAQVLELKDQGTVIHRKVRYRPKPVIKAIGPKEIPPEWFAFVETSSYDKKKKELTFTNVPTSHSIASMLVNTGALKLREVNGQVERTASGEIQVKVPFFLKPLAMIAERVIHAEGMKILEGEPPVMNRFLAEVFRKS
ncbi:MAG: hypothetical protein M3Y59_25565 [Myxococcota bacterium]|nr:hypothetical protein [Myxococcota bacterium]